MKTCQYDDISFRGNITNDNEFIIGAEYQKAVIDVNIKGLFLIPSFCKIDGNEYEITSIWSYSFYESEITEIIVPKNIKMLHSAAFELMTKLIRADLSLLEITEINQYCFSRCFNLETILLPPLLTKINQKAFNNCSKLRIITLPFYIKEIDNQAFTSASALTTIIFCGLSDIKQKLPDSVVSVFVNHLYHDTTFCSKGVIRDFSLCPSLCFTCKPKQSNSFRYILIANFFKFK